MEWEESDIRAGGKAVKCADTMDVLEYIKEYIWWCHPEYADLKGE
jgi:hypothetical protein